jgi:hypothetical protein
MQKKKPTKVCTRRSASLCKSSFRWEKFQQDIFRLGNMPCEGILYALPTVVLMQSLEDELLSVSVYIS